MALNPEVKDCVTQEWIALTLSIIAILWSIITHFRTNNNAKNNIKLQADLEKMNQQRHWRREKIYDISDELYDLSSDYWLNDYIEFVSEKTELAIRVRLDDIETHSSALHINITDEMKLLRDEISGGKFEDKSRKAIPPIHQKFLIIRQVTQQIKEKLV